MKNKNMHLKKLLRQLAESKRTGDNSLAIESIREYYNNSTRPFIHYQGLDVTKKFIVANIHYPVEVIIRKLREQFGKVSNNEVVVCNICNLQLTNEEIKTGHCFNCGEQEL